MVPYRFPHKVGRHMNEQYAGPAIYRWTIREQAGIVGVYIGEAVDLHRRITQYLKPGPKQPTNKRMNGEFIAAHERGLTISLEVLRFAPFDVAGYVVSHDGLKGKTLRVMMEHLMLWIHQDAPLLNA